MTDHKQTFRDMELEGWNEKASAYDMYAGKVTPQAVAPLLDAVGTEPGMQLLDIATGPGYAAGAAQQRGAIATGIDFAGSMIAQAQRNYPDALFYEGDAESMVFPSGFFDAAVCPFGLLHLANPQKAVAEAFRILRPGGKYAYTVWAAPDRHEFFNLVLDAITTHGSHDVSLPAAPPFFRFSEVSESRSILHNGGFVDIQISEIPLSWQPTHQQEVLDMIYKSSVRTALLLEQQTATALAKIHEHIVQTTHEFVVNNKALAWPAVMAVATKPD